MLHEASQSCDVWTLKSVIRQGEAALGATDLSFEACWDDDFAVHVSVRCFRRSQPSINVILSRNPRDVDM